MDQQCPNSTLNVVVLFLPGRDTCQLHSTDEEVIREGTQSEGLIGESLKQGRLLRHHVGGITKCASAWTGVACLSQQNMGDGAYSGHEDVRDVIQ